MRTCRHCGGPVRLEPDEFHWLHAISNSKYCKPMNAESHAVRGEADLWPIDI